MNPKYIMSGILLLLLFTAMQALSQTPSFFKGTNNLYGLIDSKGKIIFGPKYDAINEFKNELARVRLGKIADKEDDIDSAKYGFIDMYGKEVIPVKYNWADGFDEGLAAVRLDKKFGFINQKGEEVIPFIYSSTGSFHEGLAAVATGDYPNEKWGFIDKTGKTTSPFIYDRAYWFSDGMALVKIKSKYGFINKAGKQVIPVEYDGAYEFSEGLAPVNKGGVYDNYDVKGGKWGFIDKTGKTVVPILYDQVRSFSDGLACVMQNKKAGYIDKTGKVVIPLQYEYMNSFQYGKAYVSLNGRFFTIDKTGKEAKPSVLVNFSNGTYTGEVGKDGITPDGNGKMVWDDENVYEGQWLNGKRQGTGKLLWANGDVYEGQWQDDKMHGKGKLTSKDGKIYEGDFADDKLIKASNGIATNTTEKNNNVQTSFTRINKYATIPAPEPAATNFYNALKTAADSKARGLVINTYENAIMGMSYSETDKIRLIADAYAKVMEIDFHGVFEALMKSKDVLFINNKVLTLLPQDQQKGIIAWAGYISAEFAAKRDGKPLPSRPANIPEPGNGWGKSGKNNNIVAPEVVAKQEEEYMDSCTYYQYKFRNDIGGPSGIYKAGNVVYMPGKGYMIITNVFCDLGYYTLEKATDYFKKQHRSNRIIEYPYEIKARFKSFESYKTKPFTGVSESFEMCKKCNGEGVFYQIEENWSPMGTNMVMVKKLVECRECHQRGIIFKGTINKAAAKY
ncbi:MAG: WG repeat-containing protein [Bacteroidetes bacterium]|nr:WG repeat-containing protein [Bacteroidota bacterium]